MLPFRRKLYGNRDKGLVMCTNFKRNSFWGIERIRLFPLLYGTTLSHVLVRCEDLNIKVITYVKLVQFHTLMNSGFRCSPAMMLIVLVLNSMPILFASNKTERHGGLGAKV